MTEHIQRILFRTRDILIAGFGLLLLSPFLLIIALWIKLDSKGPVLFRGARVGRGGKEFKILKFRTMYEQESSYHGPKITASSDQRITRGGKWLRDTKLNELPQLWNVLVGEMSLVGPRPEDPEFVETWEDGIRNEVLSLRPGITSPASVLYRDEESLLSGSSPIDDYLGIIQPSKLRLDQLYVRHRSFIGDLDVIMWTFLVLIPGLSNYKPSERLLYGGVARKTGVYIFDWFVIDFVVAISSVAASGIFWRTLGPIHIGIGQGVLSALMFALIFTLVGSLFGIQKIHWSKASPADVFDIALTSAAATVLLVLINQVRGMLPLQVLLSASIMTFLGFVVVRFRYRLVTGMATRFLNLRRGGDLFKERVLIVGGGDAGLFAAWLLENSRESAQYKVVGVIDDDFQIQGSRVRGIPVLGGRKELQVLVEQHDVGIILFAIHNINSRERKAILAECSQTNAQVVVFPDVIGRLNTAMQSNGNAPAPNPEEENTDQLLEALQKNVLEGNTYQCLKYIDQLSEKIRRMESQHE